MVALLMVPETEAATPGDVDLGEPAGSAMDAVTRGTLQGAAMLINILAMLVVLVALVHLANQVLGLAPEVGGAPLTLERMLGWVMAPVAWLMGLPWAEAATGGALLGTKTILNELLAYLALADLPAEALSERSRLIMTYALCGFANFGSLGIMIGGLATMAPERRGDVVAMGGLSIVSGTIASCMTGAVVGVLT
jgi:CNT family concentrative nucleoside transporter